MYNLKRNGFFLFLDFMKFDVHTKSPKKAYIVIQIISMKTKRRKSLTLISSFYLENAILFLEMEEKL